MNRFASRTGTRCARWLLRAVLTAGVLALGACASSGNTDITAGWSAAKLYSEARNEMANGAYDTATKYYEKLESRYPYGVLAQQALIEVAYGYYKQDDRTQALAACDRFLKVYPNNPAVDYVLYLKGLINFYDNQTLFSKIADQAQYERDQRGAQESFEAFKQLVTRFPHSKYAADARERMRYIVNSLGQYDAHVALFYYHQRAYVAAADRAQLTLRDYPDTPATQLALGVLMDSYDKLGLTQLRDDTERVLRLNYPHSPYLGGKLPENESPWWSLW